MKDNYNYVPWFLLWNALFNSETIYECKIYEDKKRNLLLEVKHELAFMDGEVKLKAKDVFKFPFKWLRNKSAKYVENRKRELAK
jgi:hypothetical protein